MIFLTNLLLCYWCICYIIAVPEPLVLGSNDGHLALRLHFEAEHTNVLLIQVEVLQGCLFDTEVERMNVELILQEKPVSLVIETGISSLMIIFAELFFRF